MTVSSVYSTDLKRATSHHRGLEAAWAGLRLYSVSSVSPTSVLCWAAASILTHQLCLT